MTLDNATMHRIESQNVSVSFGRNNGKDDIGDIHFISKYGRPEGRGPSLLGL